MISRIKLLITPKSREQFSYYNRNYFFVYNRLVKIVNHFTYCREIFNQDYYFDSGTEYVGYIAPNLNILLVNQFFNKLAQKYGLKAKIVIYQTNYKDAIVIKVPNFWKNTFVRREVFTLLLRCAAQYFKKEQDIACALTKYPLTFSCDVALKRFLTGYTVCTKEDLGGFVDFFKDKTKKQVEKFLIKP